MNLIKKVIPFYFKRKIKENLGVPSLHWSLENIRRIGFAPHFVIDGGAYEGFWTKDFLEVFPQASILMLEAQEGKKEKLEKISADHPNVQFHIGLLSDEDGKILGFSENETASHISANGKLIKSETLDAIIERGNFPLPDFIKLDLQGYEYEVLKGSRQSLAHAEFCLLEVSLLDLGDSTPLILEMMKFMSDKGFQAYDICSFIRRPYDKALWQIDLMFIKSNSKFIAEKRW